MSDPVSKTTAKTPYPPGRVYPMCGHTVGRHDTMLYCHPECDQNELARYDLEHETLDQAADVIERQDAELTFWRDGLSAEEVAGNMKLWDMKLWDMQNV